MIVIGSDHTGIELKIRIIEYFKENNIKYIDVTDFEDQSFDDYPDIACIICDKLLNLSEGGLAIAICGTGIGISIACNKIKGIRAAVCTDSYMAEMARKDNNANVVCLGSRLEYSKNFDNIKNILNVFFKTKFLDGRHVRRVDKIRDIEKRECL